MDTAPSAPLSQTLRTPLEQAQLLGALLDGSTALVALKDLNHRFLYANAALESLYGVPPRGLLGKMSADFVLPEQVSEIHAREDAVVQRGEPAHFLEHWTINGQSHTWETLRFPFRDLAGNIAGSGFVGIETGQGSPLSEEQRKTLRKAQAQTALPSHAAAAKTPSGLAHLIWRASYACGNPTIDRQHRELFEQCNQLLHAVVTPIPKMAVQAMLSTLRTMMLQHFRDEESILEQACFPHVQEHRGDHEKLLTKIAKLSEAFTRDRLSLESFFRLLAHDVIYRHLLEADHDYFAFINPHFPIEP